MNPAWQRAEAGFVYAVGIGPGAPDLVTLRAARLIETADVIIAPRSERSESSLALDCVRPFIHEQEVIEHIYPMTRDDASTRASWTAVARRAAQLASEGQSVVQITLGDPLLYSTSAYFLDALSGLLPDERIRVVPGISSFQAAGARFLDPLTLQEDRLTIMTATDEASIADALDRCETLVLFKAGSRLSMLKRLLGERNLLDRARLACYVELGEREQLLNLQECPDDAPGYMAVLIVRSGARSWDDVASEGATS